MRTEHDLRSALRAVERETPDAGKVLSQVAELTSTKKTVPGRRPGRRLLAGAAAAAGVIAIAVAALMVAPLHGRTAPPDTSSVPRYYMALVQSNGSFTYAVVKDRFTGRTVATVQPPSPHTAFVTVTGAADDRTFVLTTAPITATSVQPVKFFYARLNPADGAVTLTPLALPGFTNEDFYDDVLSPNGTQLAVTTDQGAGITVYSLTSGTARTWPAGVRTGVPYPLSWSRTGTLAFGWDGGAYLLNTSRAGGSLLTDSRKAFCDVPVSQPSNAYDTGTPGAFLTPDGRTFIASVPQPIPVGQRPPACTSRGLLPTMPRLEEFSVSTGRATSLLYASASPSHLVQDAITSVYWSNPSGSVLVVYAQTRPNSPPHGTFGILTSSTFTPLPGSSPQLYEPAF